MKKFLILVALLFVGGLSKAQEAGLFWKISSSEGRESYLFGTYHLMGSDFVKTDRPEVLEAFESSNQVIVEMVLDSTKLPALMAYYIMPGGSLKKLVNEEDYALLKEKLEPLMGAPLAALDQMKPAVLSMTYTLSLMQSVTPDSALREGKPLDLYFAEQAEQAGKSLLPLESMEEQMEILLNSQSPEEQMEELLSLLKDEEQTKSDALALVQAYMSDNLEDIQGLGEDYEENTGNMDELVLKRNHNWIPALKSELDKGGSFIAVGALHLSGEHGLVELLKKEGYNLEAL